MSKKIEKQVTIFEGSKIRRIWDAQKEGWYFAIMDIIEALVQTEIGRAHV